MLRKSDAGTEKSPSGIYKSFLSRSFRDEEVIPLSDKLSGSSPLPYEDVPMNSNAEGFLSKCLKINDEDSAYHMQQRVIDMKRICPLDEQLCSSNEPLGFAILVRNDATPTPSYACIVRLFKERTEKLLLVPADSSPTPSSCDTNELSAGHSFFDLDRNRSISVPLPEATQHTRLHYSGNGFLVVATTGSRSIDCRIHLIDLIAPKLKLTKLSDNNAVIISVFVMADLDNPKVLLISCVSQVSQWTLKLSRQAPLTGSDTTPRQGPRDASSPSTTASSSGVLVEVGNVFTGFQIRSDINPIHLSWKPDTFLFVPPEKTSKGTCIYNKKVVEIKQHITGCVVPIYPLRVLVCSNEEGFVGLLSLDDPIAEGVQDFRRVFEGSESRRITHFERCSSQGWILAVTSSSCALISVEHKETNKFSFTVLAKRSSTKNASYSLLNVHLARELQRNVPYVLLCADAQEDSVQMMSLLKMKSIILGPLQVSASGDPAQADQAGVATATAASQQKKGFFSSIKARFSRTRNQTPLDRELFAQQASEQITTYGEGYSRKMKTSDLRLFERKVTSLDGRLHGFLVSIRHFDHDEVFLYRDIRLQDSLLGIKYAEEIV